MFLHRRIFFFYYYLFIRFYVSCFFIQYAAVSFLLKFANFITIIESVFVEAVLTLLGLHKRIHPPSSDASKLRGLFLSVPPAVI